MSADTLPAPMQGTLQVYRKHPVALPYFDTNPSSPHTLVFIPGLTDTIGTIPYLSRLADSISPYGFSLVQPQLTCNMGGYGLCTLEGDAQEVASCVKHLRGLEAKKRGRIVLMGHSTGCQDSIAYLLSSVRARNAETRIDGVILQAPVSDREWYEAQREAASESERLQMDRELHQATKMWNQMDGWMTMPRKAISMPIDPLDPSELEPTTGRQDEVGNASAVHTPAMTAYRTWSLKAKGGHDDFFSTDLSDNAITSDRPGARTIGRAIKNLQDGANSSKPQILALIGEKDEYLPEGNAEKLVKRWQELLSPTNGFQAKIIRGANHQSASEEAMTQLVDAVTTFLSPLSTAS